MGSLADCYQLFHNGAIALAEAEHAGIRIDLPYLDRAIRETEERVRSIETELRQSDVYALWRKTFGTKASLGSHQQLEKLLYGPLGFIPQKETGRSTEQDRRWSTDKHALAGIDLPFVRQYVKWLELGKCLKTNLIGIRDEQVDGFLHPFFHLHTTISSRSSSSEPNFQNWPKRDEDLSELVRKSFIARDGHVLVEHDFKGAEVATSCSYHHDPAMLDYLKNKGLGAMHADMAMQIFMLGKGQVSKPIRHIAKNQFVFPQFYGDWYLSCAKNMWESMERLKLKLTDGTLLKDHLASKGIKERGDCEPGKDAREGTFEKHVQDVEHDFWNNRFKVYGQWRRDNWKAYQETGWFQSHTGFRYTGIYRRNQVSSLANQGTAFHCLLWSFTKTHEWLRKRNMKSLLVGQVHDSMNGDVHQDELQTYLDKVRKITTVDLRKHWPWLATAMEIEVEVSPPGGSWYDKQPWTMKADGTWGPEK